MHWVGILGDKYCGFGSLLLEKLKL